MNKILSIFLIVVLTSCKDAKDETTPEVKAQLSQELKESISRGAVVYNNFCSSCHLSGGEGIEGVFPPLKASDWISKRTRESIHAIKFGLSGPIKVSGKEYDNLMPALGLTDQEVADVMNYIQSSWGNQLEDPVSVDEVRKIVK